MMRKWIAVALAVLMLCLLNGCSSGEAGAEDDIDVDLDQPEQLKDLHFDVSHRWNDMGAQEDIEDSHLYTIGKSSQNYIGLSIVYFDDAALELDLNEMEGGEVLSEKKLDIGDGGVEYRVSTGTEQRPYSLYHVRIGHNGGVYVISLMGYDISPADRLWEEFLSRLSFDD